MGTVTDTMEPASRRIRVTLRRMDNQESSHER
jgi:hypothetical protein